MRGHCFAPDLFHRISSPVRNPDDRVFNPSKGKSVHLNSLKIHSPAMPGCRVWLTSDGRLYWLFALTPLTTPPLPRTHISSYLWKVCVLDGAWFFWISFLMILFLYFYSLLFSFCISQFYLFFILLHFVPVSWRDRLSSIKDIVSETVWKGTPSISQGLFSSVYWDYGIWSCSGVYPAVKLNISGTIRLVLFKVCVCVALANTPRLCLNFKKKRHV